MQLSSAQVALLRKAAYSAARQVMPSNASSVDVSKVAERFVTLGRNTWSDEYTVTGVRRSPVFLQVVNEWRASKNLAPIGGSSGIISMDEGGTILGVNRKYVIIGGVALVALFLYQKFKAE